MTKDEVKFSKEIIGKGNRGAINYVVPGLLESAYEEVYVENWLLWAYILKEKNLLQYFIKGEYQTILFGEIGNLKNVTKRNQNNFDIFKVIS